MFAVISILAIIWADHFGAAAMKKNLSDTVTISAKAVTSFRLKKGFKITDLIRLTKLSRNTISELENDRATTMKRENAQKIAAALGVSLKDILRDEKIEPILNNPMFGYMGLKEIAVDRDKSDPFTSWIMTSDNQPLAYAWWSLGDKVEIDPSKTENRIRIKFRSKNALPSNIACHPLAHEPRRLSPSETAVSFGAFVIDGESIAISVRVTDKKGREWVYADNAPYSPHKPMHQFELKSNEWTPCVVNLNAPDDHWFLFRVTSADRVRNVRPDFSIVSRVIIEFGRSNTGGRPGPGEGTICISAIWLGEPEELRKKCSGFSDPNEQFGDDPPPKNRGRAATKNSRTRK